MSSWASGTSPRIPIGDCAFRTLELKLQSGQDCREGISARLRAPNSHTGFVRPNFPIPHLYRVFQSGGSAQRLLSGGVTPALETSSGAPGGFTSRGAIGIALLSVFLLVNALYW